MSGEKTRKESEGGDGVEARVPDVLPILPISEAVIFPYMMVPLVLSDRKLIQLADQACYESKQFGGNRISYAAR